MTTGLATPENTALTVRPGETPLPTASITSPQRRAELDLADVGGDDVADDRRDDRARRLGGAHRAEPVGAAGEDVRHVGQRLDVVDERRVRARRRGGSAPASRPPSPCCGRGREQPVLVGREPAGQRRLALDHLEHRLLLAEQVLVGAGDDGDGAVARRCPRPGISCTARVTAAISRSKLAFRQMNASSAPTAKAAMIDALDELVRVGPQQRPVLERARLALGAVAHDVVTRCRSGRRCPPTCGRSGTHRRRGRAGPTA